MAQDAPLYDLTLMLTLGASEEQRAKVLADAEQAITAAGGAIERDDDWGRRPLAFQIRHQPEAEYHLLQFKAPPTLIEELSHTLRITDGVLRFRVIKVRPGTPPAPSSPPPVVVAAAPTSAGAASAAATATAAAPATETTTPAPAQTNGAAQDEQESAESESAE